MKPNNNLWYIIFFSNHPPNIIKRLPNSINDLLSRNSSSRTIFDNTKEDYQKARDKSGYKSKFLYNNNTNSKEINSINNTSNKQRKRKIIWFNPPYNKSVVTNVAKIFLKLLDKHFPKNNKLHKIFNGNSVKVSYSYTENISQIISSHNENILQPIKNQELPCNCRQKKNCPMQEKYRMKNVLYKCIASTPTKS